MTSVFLAQFVEGLSSLVCSIRIHVIGTEGHLLSEPKRSTIVDSGYVCDIHMGGPTHVVRIVYRNLVQHLFLGLVDGSLIYLAGAQQGSIFLSICI